MAIQSYNKMYLEDVSSNVGTMFEYAVACGYKPQLFWQMFASSVVAEQVEKGNPKYLSGYSGRDYVDIVINTSSIKEVKFKVKLLTCEYQITNDQFYWAGWAVAHLQYKTGMSFYDINKYFTIEKVLSLYSTLHEADITKFLETAENIIKKEKKETNLKIIRTASGLSQSQLAKESGVELRSIQMYEQRRNDINKAQAETLQRLAKTLGCNIEDLLED